MVSDSLQQQELILAFQEIKSQDSLITGANFYLSLIFDAKGDSTLAQSLINEYIIENPNSKISIVADLFIYLAKLHNQRYCGQ